MVIDAAHPLYPHQRGNEHQQRGFRQVEIGHQPVGDTETVTGIDEDVGGTPPWPHLAILPRRTFDQSKGCRPDRDHAPPGCAGGVDLGRRGIRHLAPFGMHPVGRHILHLHRQEGARTDMQRDLGKGDAPGPERGQQIIVEMQRGGGGGDGTGMAGEDGLEIVAVLRVWGAQRRDIGRQRHVARLCQRRVERRPLKVEDQRRLPVRDLRHARRQPPGKGDLLPLFQLPQGFDQRRPAALRARFGQRDLDLRHRLALWRHAAARPLKAGRDHAGVVQDQPVAGAEQVHEIAHMQVAHPVPLGQQQPRGAARAHGPGGDQPLGQVEIEIAQLHGVSVTLAASAGRHGTGRGIHQASGSTRG